MFYEENLQEPINDEELEDVTGGKKKHKKFDGPKCLKCMTANINHTTRTRKNGHIWECEAGHKFEDAGGKPNFDKPIY